MSNIMGKIANLKRNKNKVKCLNNLKGDQK